MAIPVARRPETPRLILRCWSPSDLPALTGLFADPRFSWFPFRRARTPDEARAFLHRTQEHWRLHDIGRWAVCDRATGRLIGYVGANELIWPARQDAWDVGWRLAAHAWGRGLAREAAHAAIADVFARTGAVAVVATAEPVHRASRRLWTWLGMREIGSAVDPRFGIECVIAEVSRAAWRRRGVGT
jgi:RimJ/RimL family protein N-acetyltransferase